MNSNNKSLINKLYLARLNNLCRYWLANKIITINSVALLTAIGTIFTVGIPKALADTYEVTNTNDTINKSDPNYIGSLRWAVEQAETNPGTDTIRFSSSLSGQTIRLTEQDPQIRAIPNCANVSGQAPIAALQLTESVNIDASFAPGLKISGGWNGVNQSTVGRRIFYIPSRLNRPVLRPDGVTETNIGQIDVVINDIYLTDGNAGPSNGGGGENQPCNNGGAIYADMNIAGSELILDRVTITNSHSNDGGAINFERGTLIINNSTLAQNKTRDDGGALDLDTGTTTTITNSTLAHNIAGFGGSSNSTGNNGGAIRIDGGALNLTYVTVAHNKTDNGTGGAFQINSSNTIGLRNTLIVNNYANGNLNRHCVLSNNNDIIDLGNNYISATNLTDTANMCKSSFTRQTVNQIKIDGNINTIGLKDNGGLTQTLALDPTSSVNGVINSSTNNDCPEGVGAGDQRYFFRAVGSRGCEPGAYELQDIGNLPPTIDLDGADATATGNNYQTSYTINGMPVKATSPDTGANNTQDTVITDPNAEPIQQAIIEINPSSYKTGDKLTINGSLPRGINLDTANSTDSKIVLVGRGFWAEYEQALELIEFSTTSTDGSDRLINFQVTDTTNLTSDTAVSTVKIIILRDYGDGPVSYDDTAGGGTIDGSDNPASHIIDSRLYLGSTTPDEETASQSSTAADGDDNSNDDEDGITSFPSLDTNTTSYSLTATVNNTTGSLANVYAWIDFDGDGEFDEDERATVANGSITLSSGQVPNNSSGTVTLNWNNIGSSGPDISQGDTFVRIRLSTNNLDSTTETTARDDASVGAASNGEVEDYALAIATPPPPISGTACEVLLINDSFEIPALNSSPPTPYQTFQPGTIAAYYENDVPGWFSSADNYIEIWRNGNTASGGVLAYEGEQFAEINAYTNGSLYQDVATTPGSVITWQFAHRGRAGLDTMNLKIGPPGATVAQINPANGTTSFSTDNSAWVVYQGTYIVPAGQTTTRFEYEAVSTAGGNPSVGNFIDAVRFGPLCDHGDADTNYPVLRNNSGAAHVNDGITFLGKNIRIELDGQPSPLADGDDGVPSDIDNTDDEDGVTFTSDLKAGKTATVNIDASVDGYLNAWIDFNNDNDWDDSGEQIFKDRALTTGTNELSFNVPTDANQSNTYARFRYSSQTGLTPTGIANNGEVEDYQITISSDPNIVLVKRITAINENRFDTVYIDDSDSGDNESGWPSPTTNGISNFLAGSISEEDVRPGDEVEYTIYFLNNGSEDAINVSICDVLRQPNLGIESLLVDTYGSGRGLQLQLGDGSGTDSVLNLTNAIDDDAGSYYLPNTDAPATCNAPIFGGDWTGPLPASENISGSVLLNLDRISHPDSTDTDATPAYGFIRFRTKID